MLRVISGKYRSRKLEQPSKEITRPARDMVKESFFSMIQFIVPNSNVLDLFAGSGSLAIEAISRGAEKATIVDINDDAIKVINKNISNLAIENAKIVKNDVLRFLDNCEDQFDIIFLDPPYKMLDLYSKTLDKLVEKNILAKDGYIIVETDSPEKIIHPNGLKIHKIKKYGKTYILIFANNV